MQITPSLELCQKMKELGYPQEGTYLSYYMIDDVWVLDKSDPYPAIHNYTDWVAAPIVDEMVEWLKCLSHAPKCGYAPIPRYYFCELGAIYSAFKADTLSNACVLAVTWVLQNTPTADEVYRITGIDTGRG